MRRWWARRARWHQAAMVLGVVAVLAIIAAAVGCSLDDESSEKSTTSAEAGASVPTASVEEPTPRADTGRMTRREWRLAKSVVSGVNRDVRDYTDRVAGRCAVLLEAVEVAEAFTCFDDAYDGVEDRIVVSVYQLDGLKADVAKQCAKALRYAYNVANEDLFQALRTRKEALDSLDSLVIAPHPALRLQRNRWDHASGAMLQLCAPAQPMKVGVEVEVEGDPERPRALRPGAAPAPAGLRAGSGR